MIKVDNFLGCMKLETGGLIIGWLNLASSCLGVVVSVISIVAICLYSCLDLARLAQDNGEDFHESCSALRGVAIGVLVIIILICAAFVFIAYLCIKGVQTRIPGKIKPMMIVMAVLAVLSFLNVLSFDPRGIVAGLVYGAAYGYGFIVLHSLYTTFREERESAATGQHLQDLKA